MLLKGQEWGPVFNSSGARGFFGEGYWFHRPWKRLGLDYAGSDFVAKTTTVRPRKGNMPLKKDGMSPRELVPKCVIVKPWKGAVLNSVGLSGPGSVPLFRKWRYLLNGYGLRKIVISFMSVRPDLAGRIEEAAEFARLLDDLVESKGSRDWKTDEPRVALQINFSCPNVGIDVGELVAEMGTVLSLFQPSRIPVMVKVAATVPPEVVRDAVMDHPGCDAVVCSNSIPWGHLAGSIDWRGIFGAGGESPLSHLGGGGLSGKPLLPIVREWIRRARDVGLTKPIVGCGGILSTQDADQLIDVGADGIELGSVSILRPWRVQGIVRHVNARYDREADQNT